MLALIIKIYSVFIPFVKEILLGNKRIKNSERNVNYFLIFVLIAMFMLLFVSNMSNSKLISKTKELEKKISVLEEQSKTLSNSNVVLIDAKNKAEADLKECVFYNKQHLDKIAELESIECSDKPESLSNKLRNLENGVCELNKIHLKENMPPIPEISRTVDKNKSSDYITGEILIKYIADLREFIRQEDIIIDKEKGNCK